MKTTPNVPVTAELLEAAGYTETQIDRWYKLAKRYKAHGYSGLSVSDRQFRNGAVIAVSKVAAAQAKQIAEATKRKISGKQPVETKLHYRWQLFSLQQTALVIDLAPGEVSALAICQEEELRALSLYQPVLDRCDTAQRNKMYATRKELLEFAGCLGRVAFYDHDAARAAVKAEFPDDFSEKWLHQQGEVESGAVISVEDELEFRAMARVEIERLTREIYPSVAV